MQDAASNQPGLDAAQLRASEGLILHKARRLARCACLPKSDIDDLAQELRMHLVQQADRFDPRAADWQTFASFILDKRCISILRGLRAAKRSRSREEFSLDALPPAIHGDIQDTCSDEERYDLERDLAALVAELSDDLRVMALRLATGTLNSVGAEMGLSRRAAAGKLDQLRELFHEAGLHQYL